MRSFEDRKSGHGFTLVEVLVVVVIVAILAAIAVPTYLNYVEGARASDARTTMGAIWNASKMFYQETGQWPSDVDNDLERNGYLKIDRATRLKWTFQIIGGGDQLAQIIATSTEEMKGGAGEQVTFDAQTGKYTGYGFPAEGQEAQ